MLLVTESWIRSFEVEIDIICFFKKKTKLELVPDKADLQSPYWKLKHLSFCFALT